MSAVATDYGVYLVTDAAQAARHDRGLEETVAAAAAGGVHWVQLRDKGASDAELLHLLGRIAGVVPAHVRLLVNDRLPVVHGARAAGVRVDGVHLGQADGDPGRARDLLGVDAVVGVSASTPAEIRAAKQAGADYVGIGAVHATTTKPDAPPPLGLAGACALAAVASGLGLDAVAIGGLGASDLPALRDGGFAGAAVVSAICASPDPQRAARSLVRAWGSGR